MSSSWSCATLLLLVSLRNLQGVPSVSLDQTSPVDVLSGNAVCSNTTVEFTCIANNVETLGWHVNDRHIASWHVRSNVKPVDDGRVEAYLDLNDTIINEGQFNTVTSKLVSSVDQSLLNGDEIRCEGTTNMNVEDSLVLNYSIVNGNRPPKPSGFVATLHSTSSLSHTINFTWDLDFSTRHAIESYSLTPEIEFNDTILVSCSASCRFDGPCVCNSTGQLPMEGINITVSAVNCDHQVGPTTNIIVLPKDCQTETLGKLSSDQSDSICTHNNADSISIDISHGVACLNGTISGSVLSYHCDEGYTIVGNTNVPTRVCLSDGSWSGEAYGCESLVYGWMIALVTVSPLIWIVSSVLVIVWSILYHRLILWSRVVWKVSAFVGILVVAISLQLVVVIVWSMFMDTVRVQNSPFVAHRSSLVVASIVLSILALIWMSTMCLASIMYSYYRSDPDEHIKIERENELYYLGRSLRSNHGQEEPSYSLRKESVEEDVYDGIDEDDDEGRIYDRISHNSDIMDDHETWEDSFTDSEGYIRTTQQQLHNVMVMEGIAEDNEDSLSYCV